MSNYINTGNENARHSDFLNRKACLCSTTAGLKAERSLGVKALNMSCQANQYIQNWNELHKFALLNSCSLRIKLTGWSLVCWQVPPDGTEQKPESWRCQEMKIILWNDLYCGSGIRICISSQLQASETWTSVLTDHTMKSGHYCTYTKSVFSASVFCAMLRSNTLKVAILQM